MHEHLGGRLLDRRTLLKRGASVGVVVWGGGLLAACGGAGPTASPISSPVGSPGPSPTGGKSPFPLATEPVELKFDLAFQGYGDAFWEEVAKRLSQEYPNITVKFNKEVNIWEQLQPKFVTGDVPDLAYPGFQADIQKLALEDQLLPLDELADAPAYGAEDKTFRETWDERAFDYATWNGKWFAMPLAEINWLLWYNQALFEEKGWKPAVTWDEFLALCEEIKASGIAPIGNPGRFATFGSECIHHALLWKIGGLELVRELDNLVPNAWRRPEVQEALQLEKDLFDRGYVRAGSEGQDNIEAQLDWLRGNSAFVPSGTWLPNEMKAEVPSDFVIGATPVPGVAGGKGDPTAIRSWFSELQIVPAKAKRPYEALEYFRIFFSQEFARKFAEIASDSMPIIGRYDGVKLTPGQQAVEQVRKNAKESFDLRQSLWYNKLRTEQPDPLADFLYRGRMTMDQYIDAMEALSTAIRDDPTIFKHQRQ